MPKVYIASDHTGYVLKSALVAHISALGYEVEDLGPHELVPDDDYPDFVMPCAEHVAATPDSFGVIIGASGQGEAMVANRVKGARAAVYYGDIERTQEDAAGNTLTMLESVRKHNDANMLSLAARFVTEEEAKTAVATFLATSFSGEERHIRRLTKF